MDKVEELRKILDFETETEEYMVPVSEQYLW